MGKSRPFHFLPLLPFLPIILFSTFLASCRTKDDEPWLGYVEADYLFLSSPVSGRIEFLQVNEGSVLEAGREVFALEKDPEQTEEREAEAKLMQAHALLENAKKGKRPVELAVLESGLESALSELQLAQVTMKRKEGLGKRNVIAVEELDLARAQLDVHKARVSEIRAQIETSKMGAREDEIKALESAVTAATQVLERLKWQVSQKTQYSPKPGRVEEIFFREGEYVPAGRPVLSILPKDNKKVRFFVPEQALARIKEGMKVSMIVDGVSHPYQAVISYISNQAEFSPPVIFSREVRSKLVFMVEAVFLATDLGEERVGLNPGQPVEVIAAG